jgi:hypothetical protein
MAIIVRGEVVVEVEAEEDINEETGVPKGRGDGGACVGFCDGSSRRGELGALVCSATVVLPMVTCAEGMLIGATVDVLAVVEASVAVILAGTGEPFGLCVMLALYERGLGNGFGCRLGLLAVGSLLGAGGLRLFDG